MQIKTVLAFLVTAVAAQDISQIPSCALPCFISSYTGTGCSSVLDFACLCANDAYIAAVTACASTACGAADQAATLAWAQATCASVGVPLPP